MNTEITFKKLDERDLEFMHKWLNTDVVKKWYGKKHYTLDEVKEKYLPYIHQEKPTFSYIIQYDKHPIGYIQTYKINDYSDYAKKIDIDEDAAGLDLFIGECDYLHKGLGKYIISQFLMDFVFKMPHTTSCIIGPDPSNSAAIKAYEKVGFKHIKTIEDEEEPEYIMKIDCDILKNYLDKGLVI